MSSYFSQLFFHLSIFFAPFRGFDLGAMISNLLLSYFSQSATNGPDYAEWVLSQLILLYKTFSQEFLKLWNKNDDKNDNENDNVKKIEKGGELFKGDLYRTEAARSSAQVCTSIVYL